MAHAYHLGFHSLMQQEARVINPVLTRICVRSPKKGIAKSIPAIHSDQTVNVTTIITNKSFDNNRV